MILPKTTQRIVGIVLIVFGCFLCIGMVVFQYLHCVQMWNNEFKMYTFSSVTEYFFAVSKGAILFAVVCGIIPAVTGGWLIKRSV